LRVESNGGLVANLKIDNQAQILFVSL